MAYDTIINDLEEFKNYLNSLGLIIDPSTDIGRQINLVDTGLEFREELPEDQWIELVLEQSSDFITALMSAACLLHTVLRLRHLPQDAMKTRLKQVLGGSITQDFRSSQEKDFFYELQMAAELSRAGFDVTLDEPDLVVSGQGLSEPLGIACKYPTSEKQLNGHLSKGYSQISKQDLRGAVSIGLENLIWSNKPAFLDFRESKKPLEDAQGVLNTMTEDLVRYREQSSPSETPADGVILSVFVYGIWGKPAGITSLKAITFQCTDANPIKADLEKLVNAMGHGMEVY